MIKRVILYMLIISVLLLSGCGTEKETGTSLHIPESENIQQLLDDMSRAVMENNREIISGMIWEHCPRQLLELDAIDNLVSEGRLSSYSQTILDARRLKDGVVCTVKTSWEGDYSGKGSKSSSTRRLYFIRESSVWKIADFNYHPYTCPTIVVGSESELYDAAYRMSETLSSALLTDTEHLQSYGDIILVGTPYDNASILDLEEKELTAARVTEDYPGRGIGIVQILSNVENYRHVIVIQGSDAKTAESSISYMTQYIAKNPYLNPGVYFLKEDGLKAADPLQLTTLVTLDTRKSSQRIREVQKQLEANIPLIEEELLNEKALLRREELFADNKYHKDYSRVFSRYDFHQGRSLYDSMVLINANCTSDRLCTDVFRLPYGNNPGTAYAYADYLFNSIRLSSKESRDAHYHTLAAHEIVASADKLEISAYGTAALRLTGFSKHEAFVSTGSEGSSVFLNIGPGYAIPSSIPVISEPLLQTASERLVSLCSDGCFINYADNKTNLDVEVTAELARRAGGLFKLGGAAGRKSPDRVPFGESQLSEPLGIPNSSEEIYGLLRKSYISDDSPCLYSTLDEARDKLRNAMGRLLAVKGARYLVNAASRYPLSQFDLARYAAGLINVEHPEAYAEAAENSISVKQLSGGIANLLSNSNDKTAKLIEILEGIIEEEGFADRFQFPDHCAENKKGSHRDKALLAFGLYGQLTGSPEDAYVILGENSSYLAFSQEGKWRYIDCKYNTLRDYIKDEIYLVFNKEFVYNKALEIGYLPEMLE